MTIGKKLMLCFGATLALVLLLAYSSLSSIGNLGTELEAVANRTLKKTEMSGQIDAAINSMRAGQRGVIVFSMMKEPDKAAGAKQAFTLASTTVEKLVVEIRPLLTSASGRQAVDTIEMQLRSWLPLYQEIQQRSADQHFDAALSAVMDRTVRIAEQMHSASEVLQANQRSNVAVAVKHAADLTSQSRLIAFLLTGLSIVVGAVLLWTVRRTTNTLRQLAHELGDGAHQVAAAAGQIAAAGQSQAQGASEQAASLEETSASSEEINAMALRNTESSRQTSSLVSSARQKIDESNASLGLMVAAIGEINTQSGRISKIIKVIDEIAFQSNILALNAAVEAARAGEAGMGFAVVADEVRGLAQRSAEAAKDTAALIEQSIIKATEGRARVNELAAVIGAVTEESSKMKILVDEVNVGSQEQSRGIEQIAKAIAQMEQVTQKNAANAEENAAAAEELNAQSESLNDLVSRLTSMVGNSAIETIHQAEEREYYQIRDRLAAAGLKPSAF